MRVRELIGKLKDEKPDSVVGITEGTLIDETVLVVLRGGSIRTGITIEEPCLDCADHSNCEHCIDYDEFILQKENG